jgi:hypothetical protein
MDTLDLTRSSKYCNEVLEEVKAIGHSGLTTAQQVFTL